MRFTLALMFLSSLGARAQAVEFEAASIKVVAPGTTAAPGGGGPGTTDPTHIRWAGRIPGLMELAFDLPSYRIDGAPFRGNLFEIAAVVPEGATKEQVREMWRGLLVSRFGLKHRTEQREFEADELVVARKGHKLKENSTEGDPATDLKIGPPAFEDGRPVMKAPGYLLALGGPKVMTAARAQPLGVLIYVLHVNSSILSRIRPG